MTGTAEGVAFTSRLHGGGRVSWIDFSCLSMTSTSSWIMRKICCSCPDISRVERLVLGLSWNWEMVNVR